MIKDNSDANKLYLWLGAVAAGVMLYLQFYEKIIDSPTFNTYICLFFGSLMICLFWKLTSLYVDKWYFKVILLTAFIHFYLIAVFIVGLYFFAYR